MKNYKAENVDEYIKSVSPQAQAKLKELRTVIMKAVPLAEEGISWGIPFYKYYGPLAGFAPYKNHVSFGFNVLLSPEIREELEKKGYVTGSKTVQIGYEQKIPTTEIKKILINQAKTNELKKKNK